MPNTSSDTTGFSLDFAWGRGFITRRRQALRYGLLDVVQTEIPDLRPSRTVLSHADDFRGTRTVLCNLGASTTIGQLNEWVQETAHRVPYAESASLDVRDGALRLRLKIEAFGHPVEVLSPILVRGATDCPWALDIIALPGWVFGALPSASFCMVTRFITDAVAACEPSIVHNFARLQPTPNHVVRLPLVRLLAAAAFVREGWRLPTTDNVQIEGLFTLDDRLQIRATHAGFTRAAALAGFASGARRLAEPELATLIDKVPAPLWNAIAAGVPAEAWPELRPLVLSNRVAGSLLSECVAVGEHNAPTIDDVVLAALPREQRLQHRLRAAWNNGSGALLTEVVRDVSEFADAGGDDTLLELCRTVDAPEAATVSVTPTATQNTIDAREFRQSASLLRSRLEVIRQRLAEFEDSGSHPALAADVVGPEDHPGPTEFDEAGTNAPDRQEQFDSEEPGNAALPDEPTDALLSRLEQARAVADIAQQVELLQKLSARAEGSQQAADYLARAGVLAYFDLEDDKLSLRLLDEAVAADATVLERHFEAVSAWETLCRAANRSDALLAVHDLRIRGTSDASMQAVHRLVKAGFLLHELGDPLAAASEAEQVLARDPVHVPALQLLAEALTAADESEQAWPVWLRLLQPGVLDDVERPGVLEQAAWFATDIGRPEALELWWAVLETSPSNLIAYQQLRRLTEGQPTRRWLVVEQECAATLGVERSGVLRTLMQLNWAELPESLQLHVQTLTAELIELRLNHNERLAWPWRAVLESLLHAPAVLPAAWATAARLAMAVKWDDIADTLWDGVAVWAIDADLLALARRRGAQTASHDSLSRMTMTHDVPIAGTSKDWETAEDESGDTVDISGPATSSGDHAVPSLAGAEAARSLAASIPSARMDRAPTAQAPAAAGASPFDKELTRLDAIAAVDRAAGLRDLERVLRTTRAPNERVELLMRKGEWLVAFGRGEEALQPLKGAYIYRAQDPNLRALLALAFAASGKPTDARSHARAALTRIDALRFDADTLRRLAGLDP